MTKPITNLDDLYKAFDGLSMEGGWHRRKPALWPEPTKSFLPAIWRYDEVKPILDAAGVLISTELAERRNLTMTNPLEGNIYPTVRTLVAAYQMIRTGETADAHRHTPNALRLILEGTGTYTTVAGNRLEMRPGDVLLTPGWAWIPHENIGSEDCYWLDFLDVPLIHLLEPMFFERHPDKLEKDFVNIEASSMAFRWDDTVAGLKKARADPSGMSDREIQLGSPHCPRLRCTCKVSRNNARPGTSEPPRIASLRSRKARAGQLLMASRWNGNSVTWWRPLRGGLTNTRRSMMRCCCA